MNTHTLTAQAQNGTKYLTEKELAERLNVTVKWLQKKRWEGGGIPFAKFGRSVRYPLSSVIEFEQLSLRSSTSAEPRTTPASGCQL